MGIADWVVEVLLAEESLLAFLVLCLFQVFLGLLFVVNQLLELVTSRIDHRELVIKALFFRHEGLICFVNRFQRFFP